MRGVEVTKLITFFVLFKSMLQKLFKVHKFGVDAHALYWINDE
jgi:hypothetical protein